MYFQIPVRSIDHVETKNRFLMENTAAKSGSREKKKNVL